MRARVLSGDGCRASMVGTAADMGVKQRPAGSAERRKGEQGGQSTEVEEAVLLIASTQLHAAECVALAGPSVRLC